VESVHHEGERNIIGDIVTPTVRVLGISGDRADIASLGNRPVLERRRLACLPRELDIVENQQAFRALELQGNGFRLS